MAMGDYIMGINSFNFRVGVYSMVSISLTMAQGAWGGGAPNLIVPNNNAEALQNLLQKPNWGGFSYGVPLPNDPLIGVDLFGDLSNLGTPNDKARRAELIDVATKVLSSKRRLSLRLNGHVNFGPDNDVKMQTPWRTLLDSSEVIDARYYPPKGGSTKRVWKKIGEWHSVYIKMVKDVCNQLNLSPCPVTIELSNELNMGGITGPYLSNWNQATKDGVALAYSYYSQYEANKTQANYDKFKAEWLKWMPVWTIDSVTKAPLKMGGVPERAFDQLLTQRLAYLQAPPADFVLIGTTMELSGSIDSNGNLTSDAKVELDSWNNSVIGKEYLSKFNRVHFNFYAPNANHQWNPVLKKYEDLSPADLAKLFESKYNQRCAALKKYSIFSNKEIGLSETNLKLDYVKGATTSEKLANVYAYRQALVDIMPSMSNLKEASIFLSVTNSASEQALALYTWDSGRNPKLQPVGTGEVSPKPIITDPVDTTPPTVQFMYPSDNGFVSPGVQIRMWANASDESEAGIKHVEFYVDGILRNVDPNSTYGYYWTPPSGDGVTYTLKAVAYDFAGNSKSDQITVTTKAGDIVPPTVSFTYPSDNGYVQVGVKFRMTADASDDIENGIDRVDFYIDDVIKCKDTNFSYGCYWTPSEVGKTYKLRAVAIDKNGNTASDEISVKAE